MKTTRKQVWFALDPASKNRSRLCGVVANGAVTLKPDGMTLVIMDVEADNRALVEGGGFAALVIDFLAFGAGDCHGGEIGQRFLVARSLSITAPPLPRLSQGQREYD